jgi:prepilin-type N-terminal cleavage/methylation domain-containing protein
MASPSNHLPSRLGSAAERIGGKLASRRPPAGRSGFTMVEMIVAVAIVAIIAAVIISTELVVSSNDRERYDEAAETLNDLSLAISGSDPTNTQTSFKWVIQRYPQKLSQLTSPITTGGRDICNVAYTATFTARWLNPFWSKELMTTGTTIVQGFTLQDDLGTFPVAGLGYYNGTTGALQLAPSGGGFRTDGIISLRMPSVTQADAQGLDAAVDGTLNGAAGTVRYAGTDPTTVDYVIMVSGC